MLLALECTEYVVPVATTIPIKSGNCDAPYKSSKHKQILAADILHALLARDTACDSLITFDKEFSALVGNQYINPMQIQVR